MLLNIKNFLKTAYLSGDRVPYIFLGSPGIGKTAQAIQFTKEIAEELLKQNKIKDINDFEVKLIPLSQIDKYEISGAPRIVEKANSKENSSQSIKNYILDYVPNGRIVPDKEFAIIILDEITTCLPDTQTAALSMINERKIGNIQLSENVMFVCLGNNKEDAADFRPLLAPLVSRCTLLHIDPDPIAWLEYAKENNINKHIYNFLQETYTINLLEPVPSKHTPFACPRSWFNLSQRLNTNKLLMENDTLTELGMEVVLGTVGKNKGLAFIKYISDIKNFPDLIEVIKNPELLTNINNLDISKIISFNSLLIDYSYDILKNKLKNKQVEEVSKFLINTLKLIENKKLDIEKSLIVSLAIYWIKSAPNGGDKNITLLSNKSVQELILNESIKQAFDNK